VGSTEPFEKSLDIRNEDNISYHARGACFSQITVQKRSLHIHLIDDHVHMFAFADSFKSSSSIPADYISAGHVLVYADRDRIC
ncbi:hypothetical protein Tco_0208670, partial [Tanacetum coccineum]